MTPKTLSFLCIPRPFRCRAELNALQFRPEQGYTLSQEHSYSSHISIGLLDAEQKLVLCI